MIMEDKDYGVHLVGVYLQLLPGILLIRSVMEKVLKITLQVSF
jgi:hypothetical protein